MGQEQYISWDAKRGASGLQNRYAQLRDAASEARALAADRQNPDSARRIIKLLKAWLKNPKRQAAMPDADLCLLYADALKTCGEEKQQIDFLERLTKTGGLLADNLTAYKKLAQAYVAKKDSKKKNLQNPAAALDILLPLMKPGAPFADDAHAHLIAGWALICLEAPHEAADLLQSRMARGDILFEMSGADYALAIAWNKSGAAQKTIDTYEPMTRNNTYLKDQPHLLYAVGLAYVCVGRQYDAHAHFRHYTNSGQPLACHPLGHKGQKTVNDVIRFKRGTRKFCGATQIPDPV